MKIIMIVVAWIIVIILFVGVVYAIKQDDKRNCGNIATTLEIEYKYDKYCLFKLGSGEWIPARIYLEYPKNRYK